MCLYIGLKTLSYNFPKQHNVYLTTNASGFIQTTTKKYKKMQLQDDLSKTITKRFVKCGFRTSWDGIHHTCMYVFVYIRLIFFLINILNVSQQNE